MDEAKIRELQEKMRNERERKKRMDYIEFLHEKGLTTADEELSKVARNSIPVLTESVLDDEVPVGVSKVGGFPDLPLEIPYPTLCEFTEMFPNKSNHYEESAMQLVAQINLAEVAPFDTENVLPKTGFLWIFWSGEFPMQDSRFCTYTFNGSNTDTYKVFYYDGKANDLRRTKPTIPYYSKYFEAPLEAMRIRFEYSKNEYDITDLEEELGELYDYYEGNYEISDSKLLGYPVGSMNIGELPPGYVNLFQFDYHAGCIWGLYWYISKEDLDARDFSNVVMNWDMD